MGEVSNSPEGMIDEIIEAAKEGSKELGVDFETMLWFMEIAFEGMEKGDGDFSVMSQHVTKEIFEACANRMPEAIDLMKGTYRKMIPEWTRIIDESTEKSEDPIIALMESDGCSIRAAKDRIKNVNRARSGMLLDEIIEESLKDDDDMSEPERLEEMREASDAFLKSIMKQV